MTKYADLTTKKARIEFVRDKLKTDVQWAIRGLLKIYSFQTDSEQFSGVTVHHNGVGFTGSDAEFLSSLAKQYERRNSLSDKQMAALHRCMPKYARQLVNSIS